MADAWHQQQLKQAEELFFSGTQHPGFAKDLFFGQFRAKALIPYPEQSPSERTEGESVTQRVADFCRSELDPAQIDREADIPRKVIDRLGELGVLGYTVPRTDGGSGGSQYNYCQVMEQIGASCASTAVFVNAHHSIGLRALVLFGTESQKKTWLPGLSRGEKIAAFALTEPEAGSDASNVQTSAVPTLDGRGYILNGEKRYITNGAIADVLTVMARTPDPVEKTGRVTAFLVTPQMAGFRVLEGRMEKCGIRGTATARLAFENMFVPRENLLGQVGKGLKLALTVLDFGRTTFGASCTGAAKFCLEHARKHVRERIQFAKPLGEFELVQHKLAIMAADTFAMESATYRTAALIDSGAEDYMLETAMLKVFASESLWTTVNDTLQLFGGAGYFTDQPFERMMRDSRINLIGEGANDVLRCFVAAVGLRGLGAELQSALFRPWKLTGRFLPLPALPTPSPRLQSAASLLGGEIARFGRACTWALIRHRQGIIDRQGILARIGDCATELYMASCVYSRMVAILTGKSAGSPESERDYRIGSLYLKLSSARNRSRLSNLSRNLDADLSEVAKSLN